MSSRPILESRLVLAHQVRAWLNAVSADPSAPICVTVRAPGGYGKTALLRELQRLLPRTGAEVSTHWWSGADPVDDGAVLLVDDAHLLDEARLRQLVRVARGPRPRLVVAHRPWPRPAALAELCAEIRRVGPPLTLTPMTPDQIAAYLTAAWGVAPAKALVDHVTAQTAGVPGFVVRLVAALAANGVRHGGVDLSVPPAALASFAGELEELGGDVRQVLLAAEAGVGLQTDLLAALLGRGADEVGDLLEAARSTGLVGRDGALVPVARLAVAALSPVALRVGVRQRLAELQLARGAPVLPLVRPLLGTDVGAGMAEAFETAGEEALGADPALSARLFAAAAAAGRTTVVRHARAAALAGDLDSAIRLSDQLLSTADSPERADGALLAATALAHRGQWARSAEMYRWAGQGASVPYAVIGFVATGRLADAEQISGGSAPGDGPPTLVASAASLMAQGVRESVAGSAVAALSSLVQAAALLEPAGSGALLPDSPAALAALVALHCGELDIGEAVLARAVASGVGGALLSARHRLLQAWLLMVRGQPADAGERLGEICSAPPRGRPAASTAPAGSGLQPRDQLVAAALRVGLARRSTDLGALHRAWPDACEALVRHPVDLFSILPLGELAIAAARLGEQQRLSSHLHEADQLLRSLDDPPLWTVHLHWCRLHAAILAEQPSSAEQHVAALAAYRGHSAYATAVSVAAESWLSVLTGQVDPGAVEAAARGLHAAGMCWDAARLAGQAAIRTSDRKAMTALLECARLLQGRHAGRQVVAPVAGGSGDVPAAALKAALSRREVEVARLVIDGLTYKEIGDRLFISAKTVEHHIARMRQRLGCGNRSELLAQLRILTAEPEMSGKGR